jgi:superfamily I DNA/RNA helicase
LAKGEKIGVLLPQKRQVFGFATAFREAGLEVESQDELDFSSNLPKVITYHSAKGLTFDTVLLPRLVRGSFSNMSDGRIERLLFVAISRATKWVYMSTQGGGTLEAIQRLVRHGRTEWLTIQESRQSVPDSPRQQESRQPQPAFSHDDLLDLL